MHMEFTVITTTLLIALPFYLLVSVGLITLIKLMGFTKPSVFRMSVKYFARWIMISLVASLLTAYYAAQDFGAGEYSYTIALFFGLGIGTFMLIALDLLAIKAEA